MDTLASQLDRMSVPGDLYEKLQGGDVRCHACAHRCLIHAGRRGICQVRYNRAGVLMVPWGYVASLQSDPIEKKPFYHFLPGEDALTFGMLGCDFHCGYCQNWVTSQALQDEASNMAGNYIRAIDAETLIAFGRRMGASIVASSYNEPLITTEWAHHIFTHARAAGMKCVYVSNGFATPETLDYLAPVLDGYKVDLKSMQESVYRQLGGKLQPVLDTIRATHDRGLWVEVVTLIVPELNDSVDELMAAARFIASVSAEIPWHVTAFHGDYRMQDRENTSREMLLRAAEIGQEAGLQHVYAGNLPGHVEGYEQTRCPHCQTTLIGRQGFHVTSYKLLPGGHCPECGQIVAGVWADNSESVKVDQGENFRMRRPRFL